MFGIDVADLFGIACVLTWAFGVGTVLLCHLFAFLRSVTKPHMPPPPRGGRRVRSHTRTPALAPGAHTPWVWVPRDQPA